MNELRDTGAAYQLRSGLMVYPAQDEALGRALIDLVENLPARFALLADNSGLVIGFHGERGTLDLIALGSLAAGDLAASQAMGRLVGEYADYQLILREGRTHNMFLGEASRELVLLVQVAADVPLGWARMMVLDTVKDLERIITTPPPAMALESSGPLTPNGGDDAPETDFDASELGDLFSQALDDMWNQD